MNGTQTLNRALDILFALSEAPDTLTVSEIAEKVSIPESTTYRFLQTLEQNGIVERRGKSQIGLGLRILDLARRLSHQMHRELLPLALPIMEKLTAQTQETSILFVRTGLDCVCVQNVRSQALLQFAVENGRVLPLTSGASGKCILAYENERIIHRVVDTLGTETDKEALLIELEEIRKKGYSITHGEVDPDIYAIAAPIRDAHGLIVASLSTCGPYFRSNPMYDQRIISLTLDAASQLSRRLGNNIDYEFR
ncbi:IclR family transcriptional regulator [Paenibacillus cineris]|uniref:IclR family transcriptional regulator n=1 Tax=Paenibacillus cineris TaxID=237530 RepID=UPI001B2EBE6E|nr:IclR family transcriptional regulator [Paenibacillus cineris]GIO59962.1 transcriptional regulator [Paenibacillus cineris]